FPLATQLSLSVLNSIVLDLHRNAISFVCYHRPTQHRWPQLNERPLSLSLNGNPDPWPASHCIGLAFCVVLLCALPAIWLVIRKQIR
ncbi:hypothetical protein NL676_018048, partial [Syzygium grande]